MKKTLLFLVGLGVAMTALAQNPFTCTTEGAKLTYKTLDAKGKETSTSVMDISKVVTSGDTFKITQMVQVFIGGTAFTEPVKSVSVVRDGNVEVNFGGLALSAEGAGFILPKNLGVGMELPTGEVTVEMLGVKTKQDITSHKVVAQETITVPAGTYECYVVDRQYIANVLGLKVKGSTKTWYARGVGAVRTETYDKKGKLSSSQVLAEVVLP